MSGLWRRRLGGLVAIAIAGLGLGWVSFGDLGDNLVYYLSTTELNDKGTSANGQLVRLGGLVVPGSFDLTQCNPGCTFRITDGKTEMTIHSQGLPPQMFRDGIGVVVEGRLEGTTFETDRIMVKHSNEYKAPENGEKPSFVEDVEGGY